jgi:hypothetical protein
MPRGPISRSRPSPWSGPSREGRRGSDSSPSRYSAASASSRHFHRHQSLGDPDRLAVLPALRAHGRPHGIARRGYRGPRGAWPDRHRQERGRRGGRSGPRHNPQPRIGPERALGGKPGAGGQVVWTRAQLRDGFTRCSSALGSCWAPRRGSSGRLPGHSTARARLSLWLHGSYVVIDRGNHRPCSPQA